MLSRFKVSHSEIRKGIMELNDNVLSIENLNALVSFVPTSEEMELLIEYEGDKTHLGLPEKFYLEIGTIPRLEERLKATLAKRNFSAKITIITEALEMIRTAIKEVMGCRKLIGVMEIVLAVGNYLNGGTTRGGFYAFKLDTLTKLSDIKASAGGSLLNYVVKLSEARGFTTLSDELKTVHDASKESLQNTITDLQKLKLELALIKAEGTHTEHDASFQSVMSAFVEQGTREYDHAEKLSKETDDAYNSMCRYFVEDPKNDSIQFFETISKFLSSWERAKKENTAKPPGKK